MSDQPLAGKTVLITGAARRLGRLFALACARAGADVVIHHAHSDSDAETLREDIAMLGRRAWVFKADLADSIQTQNLFPRINRITPIHFLINNAAIFEPLNFELSTLDAWNRHLTINLTAPFLLSQAFARQADEGARIVNILDWRALRPGPDHFRVADARTDKPQPRPAPDRTPDLHDPAQRATFVAALERQMREAAANLEFELAAMLRDQINDLKAAGAPDVKRSRPVRSRR